MAAQLLSYLTAILCLSRLASGQNPGQYPQAAYDQYAQSYEGQYGVPYNYGNYPQPAPADNPAPPQYEVTSGPYLPDPHPQKTYPEPTYPQPPYPEQPYPQPPYPEQPYPQPPYSEQSNPQPTYPEQPYPQPTNPEKTYPALSEPKQPYQKPSSKYPTPAHSYPVETPAPRKYYPKPAVDPAPYKAPTPTSYPSSAPEKAPYPAPSAPYHPPTLTKCELKSHPTNPKMFYNSNYEMECPFTLIFNQATCQCDTDPNAPKIPWISYYSNE